MRGFFVAWSLFYVYTFSAVIYFMILLIIGKVLSLVHNNIYPLWVGNMRNCSHSDFVIFSSSNYNGNKISALVK